MPFTLHIGEKSEDFPTIIGAMQGMHKAKHPCWIEGPETKASSSAWEKWRVRTPHTTFLQYVSPDGENICDDDEFLIRIENMKDKLLEGVSMS